MKMFQQESGLKRHLSLSSRCGTEYLERMVIHPEELEAAKTRILEDPWDALEDDPNLSEDEGDIDMYDIDRIEDAPEQQAAMDA